MSRAASSTSLSRRIFLGSLLGLSGCGFRPLYGPMEDGGDLPAELAAVRIGPLYERSGQLLRRNLQRRMEGSAPGTPARYLLNVTVRFGVEPLGYRRDGTISRVRYVATGDWELQTLTVPPQQVARSAIPYRTLDSFNVPDLQFFSADTARDAMEARLAEQLSEEITRQVAVHLRRRRETQA